MKSTKSEHKVGLQTVLKQSKLGLRKVLVCGHEDGTETFYSEKRCRKCRAPVNGARFVIFERRCFNCGKLACICGEWD